MHDVEHNHTGHEGQKHTAIHFSSKPYWKRMHHSWGFWIFLFLSFVAIFYYIMTVDFALAPEKQTKPPLTNIISK